MALKRRLLSVNYPVAARTRRSDKSKFAEQMMCVRRTNRKLANNRCGAYFWLLEHQRCVDKERCLRRVLLHLRNRSDTPVSSEDESGDCQRPVTAGANCRPYTMVEGSCHPDLSSTAQQTRSHPMSAQEHSTICPSPQAMQARSSRTPAVGTVTSSSIATYDRALMQ